MSPWTRFLWVALWVGHCLGALAEGGAGPGPVTSTLTRIQDVQQLLPPTLPSSVRVRLHGVVTCSQAAWNMVFVQDGTGGIYCESSYLRQIPSFGRDVEIQGFVAWGTFLPFVVVDQFRDLGPTNLPAPVAVTAEELWQGKRDGQLVAITGQVEEATRSTNSIPYLVLQVQSGGRSVSAKVFDSGQLDPGRLMHSEVRLTGVYGAEGDGQGKLTGVVILCQDAAAVAVLRDPAALLNGLPVTAIRSLSDPALARGSNPARTRGVVSLKNQDDLWLLDEGAALHVSLEPGNQAEVGDRVEVVGFLRAGVPVRDLERARISFRTNGVVPLATKLKTGEMFDWKRHGQLVRVQGGFLHRMARLPGDLMVFMEGGQTFEARFRPGMSRELLPAGSTGTRVELTGVLMLQPSGVGELPSPRILLRSGADLRILAPPPWPQAWTLAVVTVLSVALALGLIALTLAHRRLREINSQLKGADAELKRLNLDLEVRIQSRTSELESANQRLSIEVAERTEAQAALADREARLKDAQAIARIGSFYWDAVRDRVTWSDELYRIYGQTPGLFTVNFQTYLQQIHPEDRQRVETAVQACFGPDAGFAHEYRVVRPGGEVRWVFARGRAVLGGEGKLVALEGTCQDITDQKQAQANQERLESQLRQAHKMEAIGTLAGGIAHDFNNILGSIMGFTELARLEASGNAKMEEDLGEVLRAAQRAKALVHQILAFSRQQIVEPRILDVEDAVRETVKLLRVAAPAWIDLLVSCSPELPAIVVDPSQFQQVLLNLGANAIHALQGVKGARLSISAEATTVTPELAHLHPELVPGSYVELCIRDNGCGIDAEVLPRIFDPFFTTKAPGEGTGLGLSVAHGIVQQNHGVIVVESSRQSGTSFRVFFPSRNGARASSESEASPAPMGSGEHILLVDDEHGLCSTGRRMLERAGYRVTTFVSPGEAWECFQSKPADFDLVLTDLAMPVISGLDLLRRIRILRPEIPGILTTGRADGATEEQVRALGNVEILPKPSDFISTANLVARGLRARRGPALSLSE